ncbi:protein BREAKING OF ASYMMETRY IN THE STOMATAL LINEAGE-like [Primulina huaijiensis]|uniref:protein BREAKING OF ASYMMETRY IN THE STOMATAL LINEAGE-like n=1 Tax=Primulina huaijiensis TaxID=1492673 RepID=UPI003CC770D9
MSSPCTRLDRCRVKDLASCFYPCRFPLEEESPGTIIRSTIPQMQKARMDANSKRSSKTRDSSRKTSDANKICNEEEKGESSAQSSTLDSTDDNEVEEGSSRDPKWPRFSEEDYIVFCFREDGAIHMINDSKPSKTYDENNKKFRRQDRAERSCDAIRGGGFDEHVEDTQTDAEEIPILVAKGEEKWCNEMESDWPEDEIKEIDSATIETKQGFEEESFESCNSNKSDTSTNSFSFPKLGIEWIGSPVHMPKPEKHRATSVLLHCCRF